MQPWNADLLRRRLGSLGGSLPQDNAVIVQNRNNGTRFSIRPARGEDLELLWMFLALAAQESNIAAAKAVPVVAAHLDGWVRKGDFGVIAESQGVATGSA